MQDIHDIKPLLSVDFPWLSFLVALGLMLGLIVLAFLGIRRLMGKRKKATPAGPKPAPRLNPRETALRALKTLKPDPAHPGPYYLQLERVLKEFLEALHQQPITGFTAAELIGFLQQHPHPSLSDSRLEHLLLHGQMAKFAGSSVQDTEMRQDLERAIAFVKKYTL